MKKSRDYVTRAPAADLERGPEAAPDYYRAPVSSALNPYDLPCDYGMAGAVGAYEVKPLAPWFDKALENLQARLPDEDPLAEVNAALDRLLAPGDRHRVVAEALRGQVVELSVLRRADTFTYGRSLVPKLRAALAPTLGHVTVVFTLR